MGTITTALYSAANDLQTYSGVFNSIQNNIANVNTPGYAEQEQTLLTETHEGGGVDLGPLLSTRSQYLEQAVRTQQSQLGQATQTATDLGQVQSLFDLSGNGGVPSALSNFYNSFSQLSTNPNDLTSRQNALNAASAVAQAFRENAAGIATVSAGVDSQTTDQVSTINQISAQIASLNKQIQSGTQSSQNAGVDTQINADLETLSQSVNFSALKTPDGTYTIYLGGQTPLVIGGTSYAIHAGSTSSQTQVFDSQDKDITAELQNNGGTLGALLQERNQTLPGYTNSLNTVAQNFADSVNTQLNQGVDLNGNAPTTNLFTYNAAQGAAYTLQVNNLTPVQLAAASAGSPGSNENATAVANLATQATPGGVTVTAAYGNVAAQVGNDVASAQQNQTAGQSLLNQAQQQRQQVSGVSLNVEAARLLQFQQNYQAVGQFVSVLNTLTTSLMQILATV